MPGPLRLPHLPFRRHREDGAPADGATSATPGTPEAGSAAEASSTTPAQAGEEGAGATAAAGGAGPAPGSVISAAAACPSCGALLDPPPVRNRRCPRCRHLVVVRRFGGRTIYLTEAAVETFEAERRREADEARWTVERAEWLRLARVAGAPADRIARVAAHHLDVATVDEARSLYVAAAERELKAATRRHDWLAASRAGRELAAALHRAAGSPVPPEPETAEIHATAMTALLRAVRGNETHAELVGATCCPACRRDDDKAFRIADELRAPRLPHAGCPRGLCACEWWIGVPAPKRSRRRPKPPVSAAPSGGEAPASPTTDTVEAPASPTTDAGEAPAPG